MAAAAPIEDTLDTRASCAPVYVIFARGTTEIGTLGESVGPVFAATLEELISGVSVVGVTYPADVEGYLEGGDPIGNADMESLAEAYASSCPNGKIVLSGYRYASLASSERVVTLTLFCSQGAQIAHNALNGLHSSKPSTFGLVKAIVSPHPFRLVLLVTCSDDTGHLGRPIPYRINVWRALSILLCVWRFDLR